MGITFFAGRDGQSVIEKNPYLTHKTKDTFLPPLLMVTVTVTKSMFLGIDQKQFVSNAARTAKKTSTFNSELPLALLSLFQQDSRRAGAMTRTQGNPLH